MSYADKIRELRLEKDWRDLIQKGDVLASPSGLRVVRRASYNGQFLGCVYLAILRCSWTRRPYTVLNRCDLGIGRGFLPTGAKASLQSRIDKQIEKEIGATDDRKIFCWDTVGIVS